MDYLRLRKRAFFTQAYNVLLCEHDLQIDSELVMDVVNANGKNFICLVGGVSSLEAAAQVLASQYVIADLNFNFTVTAVFDMLSQANIAVTMLHNFDISALIVNKISKSTGATLEELYEISLKGTVATATNFLGNLEHSLDMTVYASLVPGIPEYLAAILAFELATTFATTLGTQAHFQSDIEWGQGVTNNITLGDILSYEIDVNGDTIVTSEIFLALSRIVDVNMLFQSQNDIAIDIVSIATVGDYAAYTLLSMDSKKLSELAYFGL